MDPTAVAEILAAGQGLWLCAILALWWRTRGSKACAVAHCLNGRGGRHNFFKSSVEETNKQVRHIYVCQVCDAREIRVVGQDGQEVLNGYA